MSQPSPYQSSPGDIEEVPGYAAQTPGAPMTPPPARRNIAGWLSLVLMIAATLFSYGSQWLWRWTGDFDLQMITMTGAIHTVVAVAAFVLGLIGLLRRGLPRGAAAAGTALAATALLSTLLNLVLTATY